MPFLILILICILSILFFRIKLLSKNYKIAFINPIENNRKNAITWFIINIIISIVLLVVIYFLTAFMYFALTIQC